MSIVKENILYVTEDIQEAVSATVENVPLVVLRKNLGRSTLLELSSFLEDTFGPKSKIEEIKTIQPYSPLLRLSASEHPLHTDGCFEENPPERFLLQFVKIDPNGGGKNIFLKTKELIDRMPDKLQNTLLTKAVRFIHTNLDKKPLLEYVGPILFRRSRKDSILLRYGFDSQVFIEPINSNDIEVIEGISWIRDYILNTEPYVYYAQQGDIYILNNDLLLHGRTALSDSFYERHVRRIYLGTLPLLNQKICQIQEEINESKKKVA